jgi:quinol monooxygenase YgiN
LRSSSRDQRSGTLRTTLQGERVTRHSTEEERLAVVAVWKWECDPADVEAVRTALQDLVAHCDTEHPLITRIEWLEASKKDGAPVEFLWVEEYESAEAMAQDEYTDVCESLWDPVKSRAIADTFAGKGYDRGERLLR